ncbi:hypothetical protein VTK56DRAFT_448 [Thermocarpiscus australiensis]
MCLYVVRLHIVAIRVGYPSRLSRSGPARNHTKSNKISRLLVMSEMTTSAPKCGSGTLTEKLGFSRPLALESEAPHNF